MTEAIAVERRPCTGACCRFPWPVPATAEDAVRLGDVVRPTDALGWRYVGALRKRDDGACILLGPDGLCTRYEERPEACREWASTSECGICWPPA